MEKKVKPKKKAKITFLGTGGGRFVVMSQERASGGFIVEMDGEMFMIDPGPGALVMAKEYKVDLKKLTGVLVSHCHPDHYTDAEVAILCMTNGRTKKRGTVLAGKNVISGRGEFSTGISQYFLDGAKKYSKVKPGDSEKIGKVTVAVTKTRHRDPKGVGFIFRGSKTIGYLSDTEYFPELERIFGYCDCLIVNVLRPRNVRWPKHLNTEKAAQLIKKAKPKMAVIQHFGMIMLRAGPGKEAKWIEKESGVKTIAAEDGMVLRIE